MLIVLDTNVLVSGMMRKDSPPGKTIDLILDRKIAIAVDRRILAEYEEVTARPQLRIPRFIQQPMLSFISVHAVYIQAQPLDFPLRLVPDPKDLPFAEVAVAAQADALVTGNLKHFSFLEKYRVKALSPADFLDGIET